MMNAPIMTYRYNLSKKNYIKFLKMLGVYRHLDRNKPLINKGGKPS